MRILSELKKYADSNRAQKSQKYFKTSLGQYGYGDKFLGVPVPKIRKLAKNLKKLSTNEIYSLLYSDFHEARMLGLIILVEQYKGMDEAGREAVVRFFLEHRARVNNWDLVDISAPKILGVYLLDKEIKLLDLVSCSSSMWDRRIAILATWPFIKNHEFSHTFKLAKQYMKDPEDLIHKASGWMLREVGKVDRKDLIGFLDDNFQNMPRVMLRYAIEKFPIKLKKRYLEN